MTQPQRFNALPKEEQERVLKAGREIAADLRRYVAQLLIGPSLAVDPYGVVNHATGVIVEIGGQEILVTADHVLAEYENRLLQESSLVFQVGNAAFNPLERVLWRSSTEDLAFVELNDRDLKVIGRLPYRVLSPWPLVVPDSENWLCIWGHPVEFRQRPARDIVDLTLVGGLMRITSRGIRNLKCVFDRDSLVAAVGNEVPPPETNFGGMSGGPAFLMDESDPPGHTLVGIVTDHSPLFDMLQIQTFEDIPSEFHL